MPCIDHFTYISINHKHQSMYKFQPDSHCVSHMQVKSGIPTQTATVATVIGGLIGIGALAYVGLKL